MKQGGNVWAFWLELHDLYEDYIHGLIPLKCLATETAVRLQEKNLPERFLGRVNELVEKFNKVETREQFQAVMELLWAFWLELHDVPVYGREDSRGYR